MHSIKNEVLVELLHPAHPVARGAWTWIVIAYDVSRGHFRTRKYKQEKTARFAAKRLRARGRFIAV